MTADAYSVAGDDRCAADSAAFSTTPDATPYPLTLWVVPVGELAGVGRHVLDVATAGLTGLRLVVLCPEGPLAQALRDVGVGVVVAPFGPEAGLQRSVRHLRAVVHALRPAVVHTHLAYADVVAALAFATDHQVKLISTEHGIAQDDLVYHGSPARSWARAQLHRVRLRRFDALIAVSESTKTTMLSKWDPAQPIHVIRNAVDASDLSAVAQRRRCTQDGDAPRLLSLARLAPEKRIDALLEAVPLIRQQFPATTVTVAGTGPDLAELEALAMRLGIDQVVRFVGFVDARTALAEHDVVVQLSTWENLSYTLLDAQATHMQAVATAVGGNPEILPPESLITDLSPRAVADAVVAAWERARCGPPVLDGHPVLDGQPELDGHAHTNAVAHMNQQISLVTQSVLNSPLSGEQTEAEV